jgi:SAM-dependent methyltransferase
MRCALHEANVRSGRMPIGEVTRQEFWRAYQPGFRFTEHEPGSPEFFEAVDAHRYRLEPHIPQFARFEQWRGKDVLEAGCGIATDGSRFARAAARYTGLDESSVALDLARRRFEQSGLCGRFVEGSVAALPFPDASFDAVYSFGVIHHTPETSRAVEEFHRVLRPGGTAMVMLYHRNSFNYWVNILILRRALVGLLLIPGMERLISRATHEEPALLRAHRQLLRDQGARYLRSDRFLSHNTDGPGNPLSKVYSLGDARRLFARFADVQAETWFLNLRIWPGGDRLMRSSLGRVLEPWLGWHLCVTATKQADGCLAEA